MYASGDSKAWDVLNPNEKTFPCTPEPVGAELLYFLATTVTQLAGIGSDPCSFPDHQKLALHPCEMHREIMILT